MMPTRSELDAIARVDFNVLLELAFVELHGSAPYLDNFHIGMMCSALEDVRLGKQRRLAISLPPRNLKSIVTSVAFTAWVLGHHPSWKIITASYGLQLSEAHGRDCRQIMQSDWYRRIFPATRLLNDRPAASNLETTEGGFRYATSVGGALTGLGADLIIVDDPTKPEEALSDVERNRANNWARHSLFTRLNDKKNGRVIFVMQRLHEDDMIGHVSQFMELKQLSFAAIAQEDEYHEFTTPFGIRRHHRKKGEALHPEREPIEVLREIRSAIGDHHFSCQYLQMPSPPGGGMIKEQWFARFDLSDPPVFDKVIQSWDTASHANELSDFSVGTTWGRKADRFYLLNVFRKKLDWPDLKRAILEQAALFNADEVLIEDASSGIGLIQDLKNDGFYKVRAVKPKGDKEIRLRNVSAMIEAGKVYIPREAHFLADFLHEVTMFPAVRYKDQVDSLTQALSYEVLFPSKNQGFMDMVREDNALGPRRKRLLIRVNCDDKAMQFQLHGGRCPKREEDGSFLISEEEAEYMAAILYRV
jgi:predicted phage terminase large subunit-like protein